MSKAPGKTPPVIDAGDTPLRDWFLPAIESNGSVSDSLASVLGELDFRARFVASLKHNLEDQAPANSDAITDLGSKLKALENTLRFRLGMLRPERPVAWFRAPAATSTGPFQSTLLSDPVLAPYDEADVDKVKVGLAQAWAECRTDGLPFKDQSSCLWRTLLGYRARLEAITKLPPPFSDLRLDHLPDNLPAALESRPLRAFLLNVRGEVLAASERLTACYQQLTDTCAKLWAVQAEEAKRQAAARANSARSRHGAADDLREEFKRRRTGGQIKPLLTPADMDALKFMGFEGLPTTDALRQRYLTMAKKLHPDASGGNDHAFKTLVSAYNRLTSRLSAESTTAK